MPSYDLVCQDCGHKFSTFSSISARAAQKCTKCDGVNVRTRFTAVNFNSGKSAIGNSGASFAPSAPRNYG